MYLFPVPTAPQLVEHRQATGLTQAEAAELVYLTRLETWSEYERGIRPIDAARWELFLIKTGQHRMYRPARGVPVPKARKVAP
jgi:hypothetical protein